MSDSEVETELEAARAALEDARVLDSGGGSDAAIVYRLYYACFHAARAALYDRDERTGSHAGVLSRFGELFVLNGELDREHGRVLNRLYQHREEADYSPSRTDVDVDELFEEADGFLEAVEERLG